MRTLKDEELNGCKQEERDRHLRGGSRLYNYRTIPTSLPPVKQWNVENHQVRNSGDLIFWLSMHGSTLGFCHLGFGFFIFTLCVRERWIGELPLDSWLLSLSLSRSRCGVAISNRLCVSRRPSALLRLWYWGHERTCRGASPSDGRSEDSESQWGTFPWPEATDIGNRHKRKQIATERMHEKSRKWSKTSNFTLFPKTNVPSHI